MADIEFLLSLYHRAESERDNWREAWQGVSRYVHSTMNDFLDNININNNGKILTTELFDSIAVTANSQAGGALLGMMWSGNGSITLVPSVNLDKDSAEIRDWFSSINNVLREKIGDLNNGLGETLSEYYLDSTSFGTAGIGVFEDDEYDIVFRPYGVNNCYLLEGRNGRVDTIFQKENMTIKRMVQEFGIDNVSQHTADKYNSGMFDDTCIVLTCYYLDKMAKGEGRYRETYIEYSQKHELRDNVYREAPIYFGRLKKRTGEVYGRGWGMDCLPDVLTLNKMMEEAIIYTEKSSRPAMGVLSDGDFGSKILDTSSNSVSVFKPSNKITGNPTFKISDLGDFSPTIQIMMDLRSRVQQCFHLDVFMNPITTKEMTLGETNLRDSIRYQILAPVTSRQYSEVMYPLFERVVNILMRKKKFGIKVDEKSKDSTRRRGFLVIPKSVDELIRSGKKWYDIEFNTQARQLEKSVRFNSLTRFTEWAMMMAQVDPDAILNLNVNKAFLSAAENAGVDVAGILNSATDTAALQQQAKEERAAMMQQQMQLQAAQAQSLRTQA